LSRRAKQLEKKGLSIVAIRDELLGEEGLFPQVTDGQFSSENLVRAALRAQI